jgi:hypothetical protein
MNSRNDEEKESIQTEEKISAMRGVVNIFA